MLNNWALDLEYEVDAKKDRAPEDNFIYITTILKNYNLEKKIEEGEIFQTYFSMKDKDKEQSLTVTLPAPTENLEDTNVSKKVDVPFYENFICSLVYYEQTLNAGSTFPE